MLTRMTRMARMLTHMLTRMTRWLAGSHIIHTQNNTRYENDVFSVSDTGCSQLKSSL